MKEVKDANKKSIIGTFIYNLYKLYVDLYFTYLEINPLVVTEKEIYILDLAAKLDATADFICRPQWGDISYPPPFGRDALPGNDESITRTKLVQFNCRHNSLCFLFEANFLQSVLFVIRGSLHRRLGLQVRGKSKIDHFKQIR